MKTITFPLADYIQHHLNFGIHGFATVDAVIAHRIKEADPEGECLHLEFQPHSTLTHVWPKKLWMESQERKNKIRAMMAEEKARLDAVAEQKLADQRLQDARQLRLFNALKARLPYAKDLALWHMVKSGEAEELLGPIE